MDGRGLKFTIIFVAALYVEHVLELLLAAQGRVVSAEELLERVWDEMADPFTSAVKVTVSRLRRKLGDPSVIETIAQAGYRI